MTKVSFITASYNYEKYISQTIESVISQTITDWELLIIDDGSKDNSLEIINRYCSKDSRIKLFTHENNQNKGLIKTLQLGIKKANGEYIVFLESDDYITNNYLETKLEIFSKYPNIGFLYNNVNTFGIEPIPKLKETLLITENYWKNHDYPHKIANIMCLRNYIPTFSCVMLKKELLNNINWNFPYQAMIDYWLWIQISEKTDFYFIQQKLTNWRMHKDSYINSSKINNLKNIYDMHVMLFKRFLPKINHTDIFWQFVISKLKRLIFYKYSILRQSIFNQKAVN